MGPVVILGSKEVRCHSVKADGKFYLNLEEFLISLARFNLLSLRILNMFSNNLLY